MKDVIEMEKVGGIWTPVKMKPVKPQDIVHESHGMRLVGDQRYATVTGSNPLLLPLKYKTV
jgi:hypothetical protein